MGTAEFQKLLKMTSKNSFKLTLWPAMSYKNFF